MGDNNDRIWDRALQRIEEMGSSDPKRELYEARQRAERLERLAEAVIGSRSDEWSDVCSSAALDDLDEALREIRNQRVKAALAADQPAEAGGNGENEANDEGTPEGDLLWKRTHDQRAETGLGGGVMNKEFCLLELIVRLFPTLPPASRHWLIERLMTDERKLQPAKAGVEAE